MTLIFCLDDRGGLSFNNRRLSRDEVLCSHILDYCKGKILWMNQYSASIFPNNCSNIRVDENFWEQMGEEDVCFAENTDINSLILRAKTLVVYRWNRTYPADSKLPEGIFKNRKHISTAEFVGSSHPKITQEVYDWC